MVAALLAALVAALAAPMFAAASIPPLAKNLRRSTVLSSGPCVELWQSIERELDLNGPNTALDETLQDLNWNVEYPSLSPGKVIRYIKAKVGSEALSDIYIGSAGSYDEIKWELQVVIRTSGGLYEFLFDSSYERYDYMLLKDIYRIEERVQDEESVQGPSRRRTTVSIFFKSPTATTALLRGYGRDGDSASGFGDRLRERVAKGF